MTDVFESFVTPLASIYTLDPTKSQATIDRLRSELAGYSDAVLRRACDTMIRTRKHRFFPTVAECLEAVHEAAGTDAAKPLQPPKKGSVDAYLQGQAIARRVCVGPMVTEAWKAKWFGGLWDFCAANHRLPEDREIARIRARSQETHEIMVAESTNSGEIGHLARSMLARYRRLANEQIGKS